MTRTAASTPSATTCAAHFTNCDGNPTHACNVNLWTDAANCGACYTACPGAANANGACASGACGLTCLPDYSDCDGRNATGCEVRSQQCSPSFSKGEGTSYKGMLGAL